MFMHSATIQIHCTCIICIWSHAPLLQADDVEQHSIFAGQVHCNIMRFIDHCKTSVNLNVVVVSKWLFTIHSKISTSKLITSERIASGMMRLQDNTIYDWREAFVLTQCLLRCKSFSLRTSKDLVIELDGSNHKEGNLVVVIYEMCTCLSQIQSI